MRRARKKRPAANEEEALDAQDASGHGNFRNEMIAPDSACEVPAEEQDAMFPEASDGQISSATLKKAVAELIRGQNLEALSFNQLLEKLATAWSMCVADLEPYKAVARSILDKLVRKELARQLVEKAKRANKKSKMAPSSVEIFGKCDTTQVLLVYLCTWSAPTSSDGAKPEDFTREQVCRLMIRSLAACQANVSENRKVHVNKMVVYRELHRDSRPHYHVAVKLSAPARWRPWKLELQNTQSIYMDFATCAGGGYHSAVRYGFLPRPGKGEDDLDQQPFLYAVDGFHPPLAEAIHRAYNAQEWSKQKLEALKMQASKGKPAPRFREADLWPICVENNFHPSDPSFVARINKYAKEKGGPEMLQFCIHNQECLGAIGEKIWALENAEKTICENSKTRLQIVQETAEQACVCCSVGKWKQRARELLHANQICETELTAAIYDSLARGRRKGNCVTLVGQQGNEGKSYILRPLLKTFGEASCFPCPSSGAFPLLNIEKSKVIFFDDYRFSTQILSISQQLLLLEGAGVVVNRPQNAHRGHLTYTGDSPIYITTLEADLCPKPGLMVGDLKMLMKRLHIFRFHHVLQAPDQMLWPCAPCFAQFVLERGSASGSVPAVLSAPVVSALPKDVTAWKVPDVRAWLSEIELSQVSPRFVQNSVDGAMLVALTDQDLQGLLGLSVLQSRKVLMKLQQKLQSSEQREPA